MGVPPESRNRVAVAVQMVNAKPMIRFVSVYLKTLAAGLAAGLTVLAGAAGPVLAGCTDPPSPGVNWQRCIFDGQDINQADLTGARLRDGSFFRATLTGSNLSKISAFKVKFVNAAMLDVNLDGAELSEADFTKANLTGASLKGADLRRARFFDAVLRQADLSDARLTGADFTRADLTGATWTDGKRICGAGSIGRCN
jgi:hypothetical protein